MNRKHYGFFPVSWQSTIIHCYASNRAKYGIMASPLGFSISPEIPSGPVGLFFFSIAATLFLMIIVSTVKGTPELAHCIYWMLSSLLNTEEYE